MCMASPCPRCGTTKTESVRHGFIHDKLWNMGYHLRRCSFCNRWRLFKRADPNRPHPDDMTVGRTSGKLQSQDRAFLRGGRMQLRKEEGETWLLIPRKNPSEHGDPGIVPHRSVWRKRLRTRLKTTAYARSAGARLIADPAADGTKGCSNARGWRAV